ncbi:hypothetical protein C1878_15890 [Gordonibacter sp. 28C]|nr:hypothetical protein C1878_15890 [Gordonibacter sp. 28C]
MIVIVRISMDDPPIMESMSEMEQYIRAGNVIALADATRKGITRFPEGAVICRCAEGSEVEQIDRVYREVKRIKARFLGMMDEHAKFDAGVLEGVIASLNSADRHGISSPRAKRYPYFSLPYNNIAAMDDRDYRERALDAVKRCLPDYSLVPFASSVCFVARKNIVDNFGLLDTDLADLETAMVDFSARVNEFGYSSLMANHVYLEGDYSEGPIEFEEVFERLRERYSYLPELLSRYFNENIDESDRFFELFVKEPQKKKKLLFEFTVMPPFYNGTSEFQLHLLEYFSQLYSDKYDIFVRVGDDASKYHRLQQRFPEMHFSETFSDVFHIGLSATQPFYAEQISYMSNHCLKIVFSVLDIIMCRSDYLRVMDPPRDNLVRLGASISDGMVAISDYTREDLRSYFHASPEVSEAEVRRILISTDADSEMPDEDFSSAVPFEEYVLVVGNRFRHKALRETLRAVGGTDRNFVVIGLSADECVGDNIVGFDSGKLDDSFISYLYGRCSALLFPSVYEGYGLPIAIALRKGKIVVVHDNPLNRELCNSYEEVAHQFFFFETFDEIDSALNRVAVEAKDIPRGELASTWKDAVVQVEEYLQEILSRQSTFAMLNHRRFLTSLLGACTERTMEVVAAPAPSLRDLLVERFLENHPVRYKIVKALYRGYAHVRK